jgi:GNAT superfamily N-acetyltransferase
MSVVAVRAATAADLPSVRTLLALAYHDNPLMRWVLPDATTRDDACAAWIGPSLDRYLAVGRVDVLVVDDEVVGAAAWRAPGPVPSHPVLETLPSGAGVLRALVGAARADEVLAALARSGGSAPAEPAAYLNFLGVRPGHQGQGHGARLVTAGLAPHDAAGTPTWLGTTDVRNLTFYRRLGYESHGEVPLGPDGQPTLTVLHRAAQAAQAAHGPRGGRAG